VTDQPGPGPLDRADGQNGGMTLARACWSLTAFALFVFGVIVLIDGYIGYAIVTLVISAAAAINLL
jgi:hypothetical protein